MTRGFKSVGEWVVSIHIMAATPARRRLVFTPRSAKRARHNPTSRARQFNRRVARTVSGKGPLRSQVKDLQKFARSLAPEVKVIDIDCTSANIALTGAVVHITAVAQSDNVDGRTGNTINVTGVALRGFFTSASDSPSFGNARFALVVDKQQVADTAPTASTIFANSGSAVWALPNNIQRDRFRILWVSHVYDLRRLLMDSDNASASTQTNQVEFNWTGNLRVSYNDTAATDIEKNGMYFVILNDSANTLDYSGIARINYTDV